MKPRILVISPYNPFTPQPGGSQLWLWNRLESLSRLADVTVVTFHDSRQSQELMNRLGVATVFAPHPASPAVNRLALMRGCGILLGRLSVLTHIRYIVEALASAVCGLIARERFDLVQAEDMLVAPLARHLPLDTRRVLVLHNLLTAYLDSVAGSRTAYHRKWLATIEREWVRRFERQALRRFPAVVVLTQREGEQARDLAPASRIFQIPLEVDTSLFRRRSVEQEWPSLAFCGTMSYPPNEEAALHLYENILPRIRVRFPAVRCYVIGRNPTARLQACAGEGFIVTGEVEDVATYLLRTNVVVVPLLTGAGMRLKILEACALSLPVVSTSLGADGLEYRENEHLLIADDAAHFADKVCSLLEDPDRAGRIGQNGRRLIEERYDKKRVWVQWEAAYAELLADGRLSGGKAEPYDARW